ncbi:MAG: BREX-1 system phosphatase PglZ type B, partial [Oscillochloris sp.]|nr:BREX-1 system phosphatase PglZ type B [Oscillochloris sp.]
MGDQAQSTLLDALAAALERAGAYNRGDQAAPAALLWPDGERQWEPLLPALRARLPQLLTLGAYAPAERRGPAYWVRCAVARALPEIDFPAETVPIVYLPGVSKQELRAVEECPRPLQPIAELQYRGALWTHRNGKDWTVSSFLQSREGGLAIEVAPDQATREALRRALPRLASEPLERLRREAPLRAALLDALLNPDEVGRLLQWLDDPEGYEQASEPATWAAFCAVCRRAYGFSPEADGPISTAR